MYLMLIFLGVILIGYPVGFALFFMPTFNILITAKYPLSIVPYKMFWGLNYFSLLAIPLFMFAGMLINEIKVTEKLVAFSQQLLGRVRGGLAHMNILVSTLFGGLNGSIVADTATVGAIMIPTMIKEGYSASFSAAVTSASSSIAVIIPPSIAMIVYATTVGTSIGALFIGGISAGILMGFLQMVAAYIVSVKRRYPKYEVPFKLKTLLSTFIDALTAIICVLIIVVGMRGGVFTATEAAAVVCAYVLFLGFFWYRNLTIKRMIDCAFHALKLSSAILLIIGAAAPFMWILTRDQVIIKTLNTFGFLAASPTLTYLFIIAFLTFAGMVMEATAILLIGGPILYSLGVNSGLDPFVVSFVIIMGLSIGPVTPPLGISIYTSAMISGARIEDISKDTIPFLITDIIAIVVIIRYPIIIKFLPNLLGYSL